jgi:hypothetical protein
VARRAASVLGKPRPVGFSRSDATFARPRAKISVLDKGDLSPDQVKLIVTRLGVTEQDVVDMNLAGSSSRCSSTL